MAEELSDEDIEGVALDIGVSSMQLDQAERGFSFQKDGPLDMRMAQNGPSAADFLNEASEEDIADVIYRYGEERRSRRIAKAIVNARPLTRTSELAVVVRKALGHKPHDKKDPATRTFQAIRIYINRELGELEDGLVAAEKLLKPGGRLAVVTFHSPGRIASLKIFCVNVAGKRPADHAIYPKFQSSGMHPVFINQPKRCARLRRSRSLIPEPAPPPYVLRFVPLPQSGRRE